MFSKIIKNYITAESAEEARQKQNAWMLTFQDLLSLLLAFFVLIYALSEVSHGKEKALGEILTGKYKTEDIILHSSKTLDIDYLYQLITNKIKNQPGFSSIQVLYDDKLRILIPMNLLFKEDSDSITLEARSLIYFIGSLIFDLDNEVGVYAISDLSLMKGENEKRNTILALSRAHTISKMLKESSFLKNIKAFILNRNEYKISSSELKSLKYDYLDRIEIVIKDEQNDGE